MDSQEKKLREETAGTGVDVIREGDNLMLRMPSGITFATDKSVIQPQFRPVLDDVDTVLKDYPSTYIDVYGHTESTGYAVYNQSLSERSAKADADYLIVIGVSRSDERGVGDGGGGTG